MGKEDIFPSSHPGLLSIRRIRIAKQMERSMDQEPPHLFSKWDLVVTRLAPRPIEIHVDLSFKRRSFPLAERECDDIGGIVVLEVASIDAADEPTSDKDNRHLE